MSFNENLSTCYSLHYAKTVGGGGCIEQETMTSNFVFYESMGQNTTYSTSVFPLETLQLKIIKKPHYNRNKFFNQFPENIKK